MDFAPPALDVLVALSQPALNQFVAGVKPDGVLIHDSDLVKPPRQGLAIHGVPATRIAEEKFGRDVVANVIILGSLAAVTGVVSRDSLRQAISESVPPKTVKMNLEAFEAGFGRAHPLGDQVALWDRAMRAAVSD